MNQIDSPRFRRTEVFGGSGWPGGWTRPGCTLFLAWQQNRSERQASGETVAPRDWLEPFGGPGDQAVTAKMSYWLRF